MNKKLKCFGCKQSFLREELVAYASINSNTTHNYCLKCLAEKQARDQFSIQVCKIFGLKSPGPRIWTERKRLMETFGYTDNIIIDCLEYLYNVEKKKKLAESLCLIKPDAIERMKRYKKNISNSNKQLIQAITNTQMIEHIVPIKENDAEQKKESWDPDEWLNID